MNERFKKHVKEHQVIYSCVITTVVVAGITAIVMRSIASQSISHSVTVTADRSVTVIGKKIVMDNVSYISADRPGPPSWVVRCIETGEIFTSQRTAALELSISATNISKQLNGLQENAEGYHFERICMAA